MKQILVFGAGKSATVLIDYLASQAMQEGWFITVADANEELAISKTGNHPQTRAISFDISNETLRNECIAAADLVISMLPPALHILVAHTCLHFKKHLLTASYVDEQVKKLKPEIEQAGIVFLYEMGLDPGIDHMSAMQLIDTIKKEGGKITSFKSHCGGLVAPESDDNPWHYKISWNPRNIVNAGKAGAVYKEAGHIKETGYEELFGTVQTVAVPGIGTLAYYANRDSLSYIPVYQLEEAITFIRTTLRHPDFMYGWKNIIDLKIVDETIQYETNDKSIAAFFKEHLGKNGFDKWLQEKIAARFQQTKELLEHLLKLTEAENQTAQTGADVPDSVMLVDKQGGLEDVGLEEIKTNAAEAIAGKMYEANLALSQLMYLGMDDHDTLINQNTCTAADVLQFILEKKLALKETDKDMIVMLHEIEYKQEDKTCIVNSSLVVKGDDALHTAMAKTVGLPLGIAAKLILNGSINLTGLHVPVSREIYEPVLTELKNHGIQFTENKQMI